MLISPQKARRIRIISGGQTGADQAALDAAIALNIPHGGWIPKGRKTEAGPLPLRYHLKEHPSPRYRERTERNILSADATLICSHGPLTGGSALTEALAICHDRPFIHINFEHAPPQEAALRVERWLAKIRPEILNVAGPRASHDPHIYQAVFELISAIRWPR